MKKYLLLFFIASSLSASTIYPVQESFWQKFWRCGIYPSCYRQLGSTVTTINGTDTLSSSRSVINTNFSNLNTDKLETGSTAATLTVTTLTNTTANVGTLNLTNALTVPNGGTASTTLSLNQILLGNGTSLVKTVNGYGTSGQFLTSSGVGSAPTWTTGAFDGTLNYALTGSTYIKNLSASSTVANPLILNTVSYNTPSSQGSANTVLSNDGSGNLTWTSPSRTLSVNTTNAGTTQTSTTTLITLGIPANTLATAKALRITTQINVTPQNNTNCYYDIDFGTGLASTTVATSGVFDLSGNVMQFANWNIFMMASSTTSQLWTGKTEGYRVPADNDTPTVNLIAQTSLPSASLISVVLTSRNLAATTYIAFKARATGGSGTCFLTESIELIQ